MKNRLFILLFSTILLAVGCSEDSNGNLPTLAAKDTLDIKNGMTGIPNQEKLTEFVSSIESKKSDQISIIQYTIEGDPLYHKVTVKGDQVTYTFNNSLDAFGTDRSFTTACKSIEYQNTSQRQGLLLEGCDGTGTSTHLIELPISKQ